MFGSSTRPATIYTGFPVKYFSPKSYLEIVAEWFTNVPFYLSRNNLRKNKDPAWRLSQVVTAIFSTLYMTVVPAKSFNPVLGETFEGYMCLDWPEVRKFISNNLEMEKSTAEKQERPDIFHVYLE